jgi:hypothetical protein
MNLERRGTSTPSRRRKRKAAATRALVELVPASPAVSGDGGGGRYVLEITGARVEFGDDVSVATLRRIVEALRSC